MTKTSSRKEKAPLWIKWMFSVPILLMRVIFVAIALFFLFGVVAFFVNVRAAGESGIPQATDAPWVIQTYSYVNGEAVPSRVFYAKEYSVINGEPSVAGYWNFDGKDYQYHKDIKAFTKKKWGPVSVVRRGV